MSESPEPSSIADLIAASRKRIDKLDAGIAKYQAERAEEEIRLKAYMKAETVAGVQPWADELESIAITFPGEASRISAQWTAILRRLHEEGFTHFDYLTVMTAAAGISEEHKVSESAARTQMKTYTDKGFVARVKPGIFQLTFKGLKEIGIQNDEGPARAGPSGISTGPEAGAQGAATHHSPEGSIPSGSTPAKNGAVATPAGLRVQAKGGLTK